MLRGLTRRERALLFWGALCLGACGNGGGAGEQEVSSGAASAVPGTPPGGLEDWIAEIERGTGELAAVVGADPAGAQQRALELYVTRQEYIEMYYGPGGRLSGDVGLGEAVDTAEARFHALLRLLGSTPPPEPGQVAAVAAALHEQLRLVLAAARRAGVPLHPASAPVVAPPDTAPAVRAPQRGAPRTPEIAALLEELDSAAALYARGDAAASGARVDHLYLDLFEPLEPRIGSVRAARVEQRIHLGLRPAIARRLPLERVSGAFGAVRAELLSLDVELSAGASFWFGASSSFLILAREGLEAVLLIGALLAYLAAAGAGRREQRRVLAGAALGVVASALTWLLARSLLPLSGASRELLEGVTALVAVAVLLYVSHWLFQKTYLHDWKEYLRERMGAAVSRGSALAMAALAFAAVYREGFETVLFYQALLFDAGASAVLAGFVPAAAAIGLLGWVIIRLGLKLPLRRVFAATNAILLYLAFMFLGKGLFNLQEAGAFSPHVLTFLPDHVALRQFFGFYPLVETLGAQLLLAVLLATAWLTLRLRAAQRSAVLPPRPDAAQPVLPDSHRSRRAALSAGPPRARAR